MLKMLKQLPRRLMVLIVVGFVWSWMEPPFFAYGGHLYSTNRWLAIGVFASYYVIVIGLLALMVREVANITGVSFKLLFKQAFKGLGTRGLGGGGVGPQPAPVVEPVAVEPAPVDMAICLTCEDGKSYPIAQLPLSGQLRTCPKCGESKFELWSDSN